MTEFVFTSSICFCIPPRAFNTQSSFVSRWPPSCLTFVEVFFVVLVLLEGEKSYCQDEALVCKRVFLQQLLAKFWAFCLCFFAQVLLRKISSHLQFVEQNINTYGRESKRTLSFVRTVTSPDARENTKDANNVPFVHSNDLPLNCRMRETSSISVSLKLFPSFEISIGSWEVMCWFSSTKEYHPISQRFASFWSICKNGYSLITRAMPQA